MKPVYYSELLDEYYETEKECLEAENKYKAAEKKKEKERKAREAKSQEVIDAYNNISETEKKANNMLEEANKLANKMMNEAIEKYKTVRKEYCDKYGCDDEEKEEENKGNVDFLEIDVDEENMADLLRQIIQTFVEKR